MASNGLINGNTSPDNSGSIVAPTPAPNAIVPTSTTAQPTVSIPQATASAVDLSDPKMSIAGNIGNYLDPNSSINQLLATKAKQVSNATGTLNSSMTDSAISNGIIANAQTMAQNDQNTYASGANSNAQLQNTVNTTNANNTSQATVASMNNASSQQITKMNNDNQVAMTKMNNDNKTILQSSTEAQTIYNQAIQQIGTIQNNANMDQATKDAQTANIINITNASLADQFAITGINVGANFANLGVGGNTGTGGVVGTPDQIKASEPPPTQTYTAPDGSVWASKSAYDAQVINLFNPSAGWGGYQIGAMDAGGGS